MKLVDNVILFRRKLQGQEGNLIKRRYFTHRLCTYFLRQIYTLLIKSTENRNQPTVKSPASKLRSKQTKNDPVLASEFQFAYVLEFRRICKTHTLE